MAKIYSCASFILFSTILSQGKTPQSPNQPPLSKGYYVVVAAFFSNQEDYAQRYSSKLNSGGLHSKFGLDPTRKLYFVYLDQYAEFNESVQQMLKVRKDGSFDKAWVRVIKDGAEREETPVAKKEEPVPKKEEHVVAKKEERREPSSQSASPVKTEEPKVTEQKTQENNTPAPEKKIEEPASAGTEVIDNPPAKPVYVPQTLNNTPVFLSLYNSTNNQIIDGDVEVIDTEHARLITKVKGNTYVNLPNPGSKSGQLSLITTTFGFRKEQHELNYKNTEADTTQPYVSLVGNYYMINFGLSRIHKGDISTLYNVYFYNDAAIMLPASQYQLNSLMQMLTENPNLKIVLHGHTNGNARGKIIYMGPSKDFFTITKDVVEGSGSARELSEARANVIREWLLAQGVSAQRVTVKGWGGSRMIHDKNSAYARKNIRVDVEIVDE